MKRGSYLQTANERTCSTETMLHTSIQSMHYPRHLDLPEAISCWRYSG